MPAIAWSRRALADLLAIEAFIAEHNQAAARAVVLSVRRRMLLLVDHPHVGRARPDLAHGIRLITIDRRFTVAYRVVADTIRIQRIFDRGQDVRRGWPPTRP